MVSDREANSGSTASVAIVTDSTARMPSDMFGHPRLRVVPLQVLVGDRVYTDGVDLTDDELVSHLNNGQTVTTSQPNVAAFRQAYRWAYDSGFSAVVSLHLSGDLSGTVHAAALAASNSLICVHVVDSRTTGAALGAAVGDVLEACDRGADLYQIVQAGRQAAIRSRTLFVVESLEHLSRGGRLSRTSATVGTMLGVRPILSLAQGRVVLDHIARTRNAAIRKIVDKLSSFLNDARDPEIIVHHLADEHRAQEIADLVWEHTGFFPQILSAGAVLGAHVGPGMIGVVAVDHDSQSA